MSESLRGHPVMTPKRAEEVLHQLRELHRQYVRSCGRRFEHVPFRARAVPGWSYDPLLDAVTRRHEA